jgi:hypothetical protein
MLPSAPVRFSTTIGWPSTGDSLSVIARTTTSSCPPAGNGTSTLIGLFGHAVARATRAARAQPMASAGRMRAAREDVHSISSERTMRGAPVCPIAVGAAVAIRIDVPGCYR